MKATIFLKNGIASEEVKPFIDEVRKSCNVFFSNGSFKTNFAHKTDAIYCDENYDHIKAWAEANSIPYKVFGEAKEVEVEVVAEEVNTEVTTEDEPESEVAADEPTVHEVPEVEVGVYQNEITGEKFLRKKGAMAKSFKESIEKYGWDNFVKLES